MIHNAAKSLMVVLLLAFQLETPAQVSIRYGCTDPAARNYDTAALLQDGSCTYSREKYTPFQKKNLPDALVEISGAAYWDGKIWAINDGGNPAILYGIDTSNGSILTTVHLQGMDNNDWEALAQNDTAFFIADVGNNASGNRDDLNFIIVPKKLIESSAEQWIDGNQLPTISFSYEDQTDFTPQPPNRTIFDCESVIFFRDSLHLFTKNWVGSHAVHYVLPAISGTYTAHRLDSIATENFMLTDATVMADDIVAFTAYSRNGQCALWLVYGLENNAEWLSLANKRPIILPGAISTGQIEAICFATGFQGWLGSEKLAAGMANVSQRLCSIQIGSFLQPFYAQQKIHQLSKGQIRYNANQAIFEVYTGEIWLPFQ